MLVPVSGTFRLSPLSVPTFTTLNEIILNCDTSSAPVIINLDSISEFGGQLTFRVKIIDGSGNASTNPITINTAVGDSFAGGNTSLIINGNNAVVEVIMVGRFIWATFNSNVSQISNVYSGQKILTPADITTLHTTSFILASGISSKVIKPVSAVFTMNFNSVAYTSGVVTLRSTFGSVNAALISSFNTMITSGVSKIQDASFLCLQTISASNNLSNYAGYDWALTTSGAIAGGGNSSVIVDYSYGIIG